MNAGFSVVNLPFIFHNLGPYYKNQIPGEAAANVKTVLVISSLLICITAVELVRATRPLKVE